MTQQNPLELAKQGNPNAIAALINRNLKPKGITTKVIRKDDCLQVMVEADTVPEQPAMVGFIHNGILKLGIADLTTLQIFGRQIGGEVPAWSQAIQLNSQLPLATPTEQPSVVQAKSSIPNDANPELHQIKEAAKKGDLQAISSLISQAIGSRNVKVEAEIKYGATLWLKIYPLAKMQPQSCIQAVIPVLNEIKPDKVRLVRITEIAPDKKKHVWNQYLALKEGKFTYSPPSLKKSPGIAAILIFCLIGYCAMPRQTETTSTTTAAQSPSPENKPAAVISTTPTSSKEQRKPETTSRTALESTNRRGVSKADFPGEWMLTVDKGELLCKAPKAVIFIAPNGTQYAVNGTAKGFGYAEIEPIWKDNPTITGTKINIGPLIDEGLKLCQ